MLFHRRSSFSSCAGEAWWADCHDEMIHSVSQGTIGDQLERPLQRPCLGHQKSQSLRDDATGKKFPRRHITRPVMISTIVNRQVRSSWYGQTRSKRAPVPGRHRTIARENNKLFCDSRFRNVAPRARARDLERLSLSFVFVHIVVDHLLSFIVRPYIGTKKTTDLYGHETQDKRRTALSVASSRYGRWDEVCSLRLWGDRVSFRQLVRLSLTSQS